MPKICKNCGAKLPDAAKFCTKCGGSDLAVQQAAPRPAAPRQGGQQKRPAAQPQGGQQKRPLARPQGGQQKRPLARPQGGQQKRPAAQPQGGQQKRPQPKKSGEPEKKKSSKKKKIIIISVLAVLAIALIAIVLYLIFGATVVRSANIVINDSLKDDPRAQNIAKQLQDNCSAEFTAGERSSDISYALLDKVTVSIDEITGDTCSVTITSFDADKLLEKILDTIPKDLDYLEAYKRIRETAIDRINAGDYDTKTSTSTLKIEKDGSEERVVLSEDFVDAFFGGVQILTDGGDQ